MPLIGVCCPAKARGSNNHEQRVNKNIKGSTPFSVNKNIFVVICAGHNLWLATLCSAQIPVNWFMRVVTLLVTWVDRKRFLNVSHNKTTTKITWTKMTTPVSLCICWTNPDQNPRFVVFNAIRGSDANVNTRTLVAAEISVLLSQLQLHFAQAQLFPVFTVHSAYFLVALCAVTVTCSRTMWQCSA